MPSREGKDTATQQEKRAMRSLEVFVIFKDPENFEVLEFDPILVKPEENKVKYFGKITQDGKNDRCSCDSYFYGMKFAESTDGKPGESQYVADNGFPFKCKHIIRARFLRFGEKIE